MAPLPAILTELDSRGPDLLANHASIARTNIGHAKRRLTRRLGLFMGQTSVAVAHEPTNTGMALLPIRSVTNETRHQRIHD